VGVEDPKYVVVENDTVRQLQVTNVSAADEGTYCCRVQNKQSLAQLLVARMCLQTVFSFTAMFYKLKFDGAAVAQWSRVYFSSFWKLVVLPQALKKWVTLPLIPTKMGSLQRQQNSF